MKSQYRNINIEILLKKPSAVNEAMILYDMLIAPGINHAEDNVNRVMGIIVL
jgi:hypothetical protein